MKSTRQRLLDYLATHPGVTARELSHSLQVTPADARHHLKNMVAEGLVVQYDKANKGDRGRPAGLYSLAPPPYAAGIKSLVEAVLRASMKSLEAQEQETFLREVALQLRGKTQPRGSLAQRLVFAVQRLRDMGYEARWEAHSGAPHLIVTRSPYVWLEQQNSLFVHFDDFLLEALIGVKVLRSNQGDLQAESSAQVIYLIKPDIT